MPMDVFCKEKRYSVIVDVLDEIKSSKIDPLIEFLSLLCATSFAFKLNFDFINVNGIYINLRWPILWPIIVN